MNSPLIIAHRGASALAPENTIIAFKKAIESGADGIEFDVRLTKDEIPIVFHDATLKRVSNKAVHISKLYLEDLQRVQKIGEWFNRRFPTKANEEFLKEKIPTLEELLNFLRDFQGKIYLEIKGTEKQTLVLSEKIKKIVESSHLSQQIVFKSFRLNAIKRLKEILPKARTAALFAPKIITLSRKTKIIQKATESSADEISIHYSLATEKFIRTAKASGFYVVIWTVDHPRWIQKALKTGIHALITNDPTKLIAERNLAFSTNDLL
jgi:glycerophosphoryl diester phosphodiesterase